MNLLDFHKQIKGYTQDRQPGIEKDMKPKPITELDDYAAGGKLKGKVALVTGGDSGIGRAVAILFAKEGANVAIGYYDEHEDAKNVVERVEALGVKAKAYAHDLKKVEDSQQLIKDVVADFGQLNILVNNGGVQFPQDSFADISPEQIKETFETNIFGMMFLTQAAEPHLSKGDETPMGRRGQPAELAPAYVFLASDADSSYITGQVIHINGGDYITS